MHARACAMYRVGVHAPLPCRIRSARRLLSCCCFVQRSLTRNGLAFFPFCLSLAPLPSAQCFKWAVHIFSFVFLGMYVWFVVCTRIPDNVGMLAACCFLLGFFFESILPEGQSLLPLRGVHCLSSTSSFTRHCLYFTTIRFGAFRPDRPARRKWEGGRTQTANGRVESLVIQHASRPRTISSANTRVDCPSNSTNNMIECVWSRQLHWQSYEFVLRPILLLLPSPRCMSAMEFGAELTFPVPEGTSGTLIMVFSNLIGFIHSSYVSALIDPVTGDMTNSLIALGPQVMEVGL